MNALYSSLSEIYDAIYKTFINYEEEFEFYFEHLKENQCRSVLEIGCGTGNLAKRFADNSMLYSGIDLSEDMLKIAERNNPNSKFIKADMRNFKIQSPAESCIITGRSLSYLITNQDVINTFNSIHYNLNENGILCFDFIDANKFIPLIEKGKEVDHYVSTRFGSFHRRSYWQLNPLQSWLFDWHSIFYKEENGKEEKIGEDNSTIRTFTSNEISIFLQLTGFTVLEIISRPSYAFDTLVFIARKLPKG